MLSRLRVEVRDLFELLVLPGLVLVLPWRVCYRVFLWACRSRWLYRRHVEPALANARRLGAVDDSWRWARDYRLGTLLDHADFYVARFRGWRGIARRMGVKGAWPERGPFLGLGFHWGAGLWTLDHLRASGFPPATLYRPISREAHRGRWVLYRYYKARERYILRVGDDKAVGTGNSYQRIVETFARGDAMLALADVPPAPDSGTTPFELLGWRARMRSGILRLVVDEGVPVVFFRNELDDGTGRRRLVIEGELDISSVEALARQLETRLGALFNTSTAAWRLWPWLSTFLADDAPPEA